MKLIVVWQSTKDLTEALIQMNDEQGKKAFYKLEDRRRYAYYLVSLLLIVYYPAVIAGLVPSYSTVYYAYAMASDFGLLFGLVYAYLSLSALIKRDYPARYAEI